VGEREREVEGQVCTECGSVDIMNIVNDPFAELVAPSTPGAAKERGGVDVTVTLCIL
jgi:hypothetical protein